MSDQIHIRPLTDSHNDYQDYTYLLSQLSSQYQPITYEDYLRYFCDEGINDSQIYLGETDGKVFGTIKVLYERKFYRPNCWVGQIEDVVVDPIYEHQGKGRTLIEFVIDLCRQRGCYKVRLSCADHKTGFYHKCGFLTEGQNLTHRFSIDR